ncbi:hypothetical protein [Nocardioides luteus]|uniref:hypothetical protein n=1 Tax=Nocardioides luteus TaxID=1844 RepID=UPI0018CAF8DB|nr:hypothetical protein [Nocardioides luteus]MBG6098790.1 hypothetical protein [Nocardioides luteus]
MTQPSKKGPDKRRPRHPIKELEALLKSLEEQGWVVEKGSKYYRAKCPCEEKAMKSIHLTPSNPHYLLNTRKKLARDTCWKDDL